MKRMLGCFLLCCAALVTANAQIMVRLTDLQYVGQLKSLPACKGISYIMPHVDSTFISVRYDTTAISDTEILESLKALDYVSSAARNRKIQLPGPEPVETVLESSSQRSPMRSAVDSYPNDPLFDQQWGLKAINMPQLWQVPLKPGAKRPVIAILDSGVDIEHPDLKDNIWTNEAELNGLPGVDDDGNGYIDDIHGWDIWHSSADVSDILGHGTFCAGIAAAVADNGIGIAGANPNAIIMPVKFYDTSISIEDEELLQGLDYAVNNGADIINMSFGFEYYLNFYDGEPSGLIFWNEALSRFSERAILVASAGNSGMPISLLIHSIASQPSVIGVENTNESGNLKEFSNYDDDLGPWASSWEHGYNYELSAPGTNIISTLPNGEYGLNSGTSFSSPLVAGVISRLISVKDYESREELVHDLISSRGRHFGPIDAMAAYSGILTTRIRFSFPKTEAKIIVDESSIPFSILNDTDSILTDLCVKVNMVNPDDTVKVRLLTDEMTIPILEPDETGVSLVIPCQVNGTDPKSQYPVSFSVYQGEQVVGSSIYNLKFGKNLYNSDSICYAVLDSLRHTVQIIDYCGKADVLILPDTVVLGGKKMTVVSIGYSAFEDSPFSHIIIPQTVQSIGSSAFGSCSNLIEIDIPNSVVELGSMAFTNCGNLKSVRLPEGHETLSNSIFSLCTSLEHIDIPESVRKIGSSVFYYCYALESVHLPDSLIEIGQMSFTSCTSLKSIEIPQSVRSIGSMAFDGCSSLISIELPSGLDFMGTYAFQNCQSLASIVIPGSIRLVDEFTFFFCESMESVQLCEGVKSIGLGAFEFCSSLTSVVFPQSLDSIESGAFAFCDTLKSVTCLSSVPPVIFGSSSDIKLGNPAQESTLYVPQGCAEAYRAAEGWNLFGTIQEIVPTPVAPVHESVSPSSEYRLNRHILIRDGEKYLATPASGL